MQMDEETLHDLISRLRRIEGQARGVQRMLREGRNCEEVATQLSAMRSAVNNVIVLALTSNLTDCLQAGGALLDDEADKERLAKAREMFLKFT